MVEDRSVLTRPAPAPDAVERYGASSDQVVDVWFAASPDADERPLVVLVHGGFWRPEYDRTHLRPMAVALRATGWDVAAIEYRRRPGLPDLAVGDVGSAIDAAPRLAAAGRAGRRSSARRPVIAVGHSAGGHLALLVAATAAPSHLSATVALAPVADLALAHELDLDDGAVAAFCGSAPAEGGDLGDLDPAGLATPATPVVIVHGTEDTVVPLAVAESYVAGHPSTRLVAVPGTGHFAVIDPLSAAWPVVVGEIAAVSGERT
jgi:acetyl esterase/lipase